MYIRHSSKYGKEIKIIHPGEYFVSMQNELIGTLLGSCVAVCLYDEVNLISGMNHFMLPGRISNSDIFADKTARYGITAINTLISSVIKAGGNKKFISAKIFGGGHVLETETTQMSIPTDNIRLARVMMEMEDIPILKSDVGSNFTRKVLMDVKTGKVFLRRSTRKDVFSKISKKEHDYISRSLKDGQN